MRIAYTEIPGPITFKSYANGGVLHVNRHTHEHGDAGNQICKLYVQSEIIPPDGRNYYFSIEGVRTRKAEPDNPDAGGFKIQVDASMPDGFHTRKLTEAKTLEDLINICEIYYGQLETKWRSAHGSGTES